MTSLTEKFKEAGLVLIEESAPFIRGVRGPEIVQIDIGRNLKGKGVREEYFRIFVPKTALLQVRDIDPVAQQLVLLVKEEAATFTEDLTFWSSKVTGSFESRVEEIKKDKGIKVIKISKPNPGRGRGVVTVERATSRSTRYFLMGVDERQLFIAQCNNAVTTVPQARQSLGRTVQFVEGKRRGSSLDRQGEWFFLETSLATRDRIEKGLKSGECLLLKKVSIGQHLGRAGGNPHVAEELVKVKPTALGHGFPIRQRSDVFIRGKVSHKDHKTVKFSQWREVIANSEGATASATASGVGWMD